MSTAEYIPYFLEDIENHGRNARTIDAYRRVLDTFERFLREERAKTPATAEYRDCMAFVHSLRSEYSESTIASYASYLNRFYGYLVRVGQLDSNPMELVLEEMNEKIDTNPSRRDLSIDQMREFVAEIHHPLHRAVMLTLLKTGIRSGELCNLDLADLHLDHPSMEWNPRAQVASKPDSIFVSVDHTHGRESGGEVRLDSNKRQRETLIPVDSELRASLIRWLAIRPDSMSPAEPLFVGTSDKWGERLTINQVHHIVESYARPRGWYRNGGGAPENVTPHYFRHFFTTHLRDRTGDRGIVKYLRGDVADDIIDTYTHDWNERVREIYLDHIYSLT